MGVVTVPLFDDRMTSVADADETGEHRSHWRVAEFFAGIGLVGAALDAQGFEVAWANDLEPAKAALYAANFDSSRYVLDDVRNVRGRGLPAVDLATASFPCTDLSLAGGRAGLDGRESSMFWEFGRVLTEMGDRRPSVVLLENVTGFATSNGGADLAAAIGHLNGLGYSCDLIAIDARVFVPQSRPRMFVIATTVPPHCVVEWVPSEIRPEWLCSFAHDNADLRLHAAALPSLPSHKNQLSDVVERLAPNDSRWWEEERVDRFIDSLSPVQMQRLHDMQNSSNLIWRTAYRRTRSGRAVWEMRPDTIAGCLRTVRGGSSKQALVEAGSGDVRIRWMTPREYARLQGVSDTYDLSGVRPNQAYFGFGDAVCVPVIGWIAREYLTPMLNQLVEADSAA